MKIYTPKESAPEQTEKPKTLPKGIKSVSPNRMEFNTEFFKGIKIFIATPCYGGQLTDQYFLSFIKLLERFYRLGIEFRITTLRNESLIPRARNVLTAMFLEDPFDYTHLMFIDADIEFDADSVIRMLALDKELIAGAYPKKNINWERVKQVLQKNPNADVNEIAISAADYAINFKNGGQDILVELGAAEVLDASTGFMLIKKKVFLDMIKQYPELHYKSDSAIDPKYNPYCFALWDTMIDPESRRYLSEDYTFVRRYQMMNPNNKVWIDINTKLNHVGTYTFPGDISRIFTQVQ